MPESQRLAECVPIGAMEFDKLVAFAKENKIDFTIVGMDDPLVGGIVDVFEAEDLKYSVQEKCGNLRGIQGIFQRPYEKYNIPTAKIRELY